MPIQIRLFFLVTRIYLTEVTITTILASKILNGNSILSDLEAEFFKFTLGLIRYCM